jgi:hypothetical protein
VKQLVAKYNLGKDRTKLEPRTDTSYAKQADGTSCGFFVCFYVEAFLTLKRTHGFFMDDADFIRGYRNRLRALVLSVSEAHFPSYIPLAGFSSELSRGRTTTQVSYRSAPSTPATIKSML